MRAGDSHSQMPRVLLTGATGFVGSHTTRCLLAHGCQVAVIVRPESDLWRIADVLPHLEVITADLGDLASASDRIRSFSPSVTIHLAWNGVGNRYRDDQAQVLNLQVALSLLETVHEAGCRVWVGLGSQAEYGVYDRRLSEETPPQPVSLYGITKLCTCLLARRFCDLYDMRFVWLRLFSAYGPADDPNWMIPYVILKLLRGERPALTKGEQRWDFLFVLDAAEAIYSVATNSNVHGIFNLGSGDAPTVSSVAKRIRALVDPRLTLGLGDLPYRQDQIMHLLADNTRLVRATAWKPQVDLDEGLRRTVAWYRENIKRYS
jgi:UDP-glucose 4-epimerase